MFIFWEILPIFLKNKVNPVEGTKCAEADQTRQQLGQQQRFKKKYYSDCNKILIGSRGGGSTLDIQSRGGQNEDFVENNKVR